MMNRILGCLLWLSAVALAASEPLKIEHLGMVAPDMLGLTIRAGQVAYGRQIPYVKQPGDVIAPNDIHRFVRRNGKVIGTLVGTKADQLCTMDEVRGEKLDPAWAEALGNYRLKSKADPQYQTAQPPTAVYRKTKPSDLAMTNIYQFDSPTETIIYLRLPSPLKVGCEYTLLFAGIGLPTQRFVFDPAQRRSEAVHVSQVGFRPDDPVKTAFLSCWLGNGGGLKYQPGRPFEVIEDSTGTSFFKGQAKLSKSANDKTEDAYHKNYNGTDVYEMDFSPLTRPGKYRIMVNNIGTSYAFEIAADVWKKAFIVSARGFYHQRSGIALGEPYSSYHRPRSFHPDDGLRVYASQTPLMDSGNGLNKQDSNFGNLVKGRTAELVTNAWGGYMDAGDWDRRIQHLKSSLLFLELAEFFPDYFRLVPLNIPESGNGLPDVVNEALWNLDFFRRLQLPDGGIRGGIESSEHPRRGEASFQESLTVMAYAPDLLSSYFYAGVAARAVFWLKPRFPDRAAVYSESALRAMNWAEGDREHEAKMYLMAQHLAVRDVRNYAAAELFRLTGDPRWNKIFLETTLCTNANPNLEWIWDSLDQADCAWVYARTEHPGMDEKVKANCRALILLEAKARVESTSRTAFHWAKHPLGPLVYGALSSPESCVNVVRAHVLTGEALYLRALVLASQTGAGANPVNLCYTTGVGQKYPQHPLQLDHRLTHQAPPPGLTVGGPMDNSLKDLKDPFIGPFAGKTFCPPYPEWPALEAFWDVFWDPMVCEYTVHKPMAGNAYVWGYLAARR